MERRLAGPFAAAPSGHWEFQGMADLFGYEAPPLAPGFVEVICELRGETADGIAIVACDAHGIRLGTESEHWKWLPRSQIQAIHRERNNAARIIIPEWLARQERIG